MPFEAAKAVAATFCYDIRYALVPLFGPDFVSACARLGSEGFAHMVIEPNIIQKCTNEAQEFREMSSRGSSRSAAPMTTDFRSNQLMWTPPPPSSRLMKPLDAESGYYTDTDRSSGLQCSPQSTYTWAAVNTPRSHSPRLQLPSPQELLASVRNTTIGEHLQAPPNSPNSLDSGISPKTKKQALRELKDDSTSISSGPSHEITAMSNKFVFEATAETRAAYVLMQLHFADTSLKDSESSTKKRRASFS